MMYSQNNEEQIIFDYFKNYKGRLLDIGANDGITFSNSKALIDRGWKAVLVEPNITCLDKLNKRYRANIDVRIAPFAIGTQTGEVTFHESGTLLKKDDHSLVSTLKPTEIDRWKGTVNFTETKVDCLTWNDFYSKYSYYYDFVSIDAEGVDFDILSQMNLNAIKCKLICVESNGIDNQKYIEYISQFGHKLIHINAENIIMGL